MGCKIVVLNLRVRVTLLQWCGSVSCYFCYSWCQ